MSDDGIQWCKKDRSDHASYTLLPIYHKTSSKCVGRARDDDRFSVNFMQNPRQHRNRNRINRDISNVRRTCSDDSQHACNHSSTHSSSLKWRRTYRLLNICLMITLHLICNGLVTHVNCDELLASVGARGHFTHTWAVHIPGGDETAEKVAVDHGMYLRGKVSHEH